MSTEAIQVRLCDDDGMVSNTPVEPGSHGTEFNPSLTYLRLTNNLRAHTGLAPVEGFHCTGSAHLAGEVFHCTSPAHGGYIPGSPVPVFIHPDDQFFTRGTR